MSRTTMPEPRPRRRRSPQTRREEILRAASKLFAEKGYTRTTTKEIAREAHIAEGTIYKYFASKQDLLFTFLESTVVEPLQSLMTNLAEASDEEVISALIINRLNLWNAKHEFVKATFVEALHNPELAIQMREKLFAPGMRIVEGFLARRAADGAFRQVDAAVVLRALIGAMFTFTILREIFGEVPADLTDTDHLTQELTALFLYGVQQPASATNVPMPVSPFLSLLTLV